MIMTGCLSKRRFSLKYPDGWIERFGSCDPKEDDRREIGRSCDSYFLRHHDIVNSAICLGSEQLPKGTLWTNGYYDKEHDGWKPMEEWA